MKGFSVTTEQVLSSYDGDVIVDGFVFFWLENTTYMLIHNPKQGEECGGLIQYSKRSIEDHVQFINDNNVEHLVVCRRDISFLRDCPGVKSVSVTVPAFCSSFDFTPLYDMESLAALACNLARDIPELSDGLDIPKLSDKDIEKNMALDFTKMKGLKQIHLSSSSVFKGAKNFQQLDNLECLMLNKYKGKNLRDYFDSKKLKYLDL